MLWLLLCVIISLSVLLWVKKGKRFWLGSHQFPKYSLNPFKLEDIKSPQPTVTDAAKRAAVLKQPFKPHELDETWDAIIIGSGMGGLSAGAILSKAKWRVLVLEQHDLAGGCSHTFSEHGYEFDVGVHIVPQMGKGTCLRALSDFITNGQLDWAKLDEYFDVAYVGGKSYPIKEGGPVIFRQQLKEWFPDDAQDIDNYYENVFALHKSWTWLSKAKKMNWYLWKFLAKTGLLKYFTDAFELASVTASEMIKRHIRNAELQMLLAYHYLYYAQPMRDASFLLHGVFALPGGYYPVGGSSEVAFTTIPVIEESGGRVLTRANIKEILIDENGRAYGVSVTKSGKENGEEWRFYAPAIISNAAVATTFKKLLPRSVAEKSRYWPALIKLTKCKWGGLQVFVGLKGTTEELGLKACNYFAWEGGHFEDMDKWLNLSAEEALDTTPPDFFFCSSSAKDPRSNLRHPGKSTLHIVAVSNVKWFDEWKNRQTVKKRGADYETYKKTLGDALLERVLNYLPHLRDKIDYFEVSTPLTQKYYINNNQGEYYSLDHSLARFEPETWGALRPDTDIPGQDVALCGLGSVIWAGLECGKILLNRNLEKDLNDAMASNSAT